MSSFLEKRRNDAVYTNQPILQGRIADIHITERGSNWLWAAFSIFALAFLVLLGLTFRKPVTHRAFHYIFVLVLLITALDYYSLAANLSFVPIPVEFVRSRSTVSGSMRQVWYSRYIDWFITDALLWLAVLLVARAPWQQILFVIILTWVTITCGLLGALTPTVYKWGFFAFAIFSAAVIAYNVMVPARRHAGLGGADVGKTYTSAAGFFLLLWLLYPIAWGLSEGGNVIAPDSEMVFYGVLDIVRKLGVIALVLFGLRKVEPSYLGLSHRGWDHDGAHNGTHNGSHIKNGHSPVAPATTTTTV